MDCTTRPSYGGAKVGIHTATSAKSVACGDGDGSGGDGDNVAVGRRRHADSHIAPSHAYDDFELRVPHVGPRRRILQPLNIDRHHDRRIRQPASHRKDQLQGPHFHRRSVYSNLTHLQPLPRPLDSFGVQEVTAPTASSAPTAPSAQTKVISVPATVPQHRASLAHAHEARNQVLRVPSGPDDRLPSASQDGRRVVPGRGTCESTTPQEAGCQLVASLCAPGSSTISASVLHATSARYNVSDALPTTRKAGDASRAGVAAPAPSFVLAPAAPMHDGMSALSPTTIAAQTESASQRPADSTNGSVTDPGSMVSTPPQNPFVGPLAAEKDHFPDLSDLFEGSGELEESEVPAYGSIFLGVDLQEEEGLESLQLVEPPELPCNLSHDVAEWERAVMEHPHAYDLEIVECSHSRESDHRTCAEFLGRKETLSVLTTPCRGPTSVPGRGVGSLGNLDSPHTPTSASASHVRGYVRTPFSSARRSVRSNCSDVDTPCSRAAWSPFCPPMVQLQDESGWSDDDTASDRSSVDIQVQADLDDSLAEDIDCGHEGGMAELFRRMNLHGGLEDVPEQTDSDGEISSVGSRGERSFSVVLDGLDCEDQDDRSERDDSTCLSDTGAVAAGGIARVGHGDGVGLGTPAVSGHGMHVLEAHSVRVSDLPDCSPFEAEGCRANERDEETLGLRSPPRVNRSISAR